MEVTSYDYLSATNDQTTEPYTTATNDYRLVSLNENETCAIAYDMDARINMFFNGTKQPRNNRNNHQESQILIMEEINSFLIGPQSYRECILYILPLSYYTPTNLVKEVNTWYTLEKDKNNEVCMCDWNHIKIEVNNTLSCWCIFSYNMDESLISLKEPMHLYFRRICNVLKSIQKEDKRHWLTNCTYTDFPFAIEKLYFNISNTDQLETTSELIKSTSTKSTESSTATTSQTSLTQSTQRFKKTISTTSLSKSTEGSQNITSQNSSSQSTEGFKTTISKTSLTKFTEGSKNIISENSSPQSMGSSNIITSLTSPKQNTHDESTLVPSTISRENAIHTSKTNTGNLNSLSRSSHTGNSQIVAEAQQGKLSSVANQYNYAVTTNPILFLFFLFFHLFMYYGFLRKEYFHMKKKRR